MSYPDSKNHVANMGPTWGRQYEKSWTHFDILSWDILIIDLVVIQI